MGYRLLSGIKNDFILKFSQISQSHWINPSNLENLSPKSTGYLRIVVFIESDNKSNISTLIVIESFFREKAGIKMSLRFE